MTDNQIEYNVIHNARTWLKLHPDKIDIIHVSVADCPQFIFEVKKCYRDETTKAYIYAFVIPTLHRIRDYIVDKKINYEPEGAVKFIFDLSHPVKNAIDPLIFQYYIPADRNIAELVCERLFFHDERLEASQDDVQILYYYLSVLTAVDHPVFNRVLQRFTNALNEENYVLSTLVPSFVENSERVISSSSAIVSNTFAVNTTNRKPVDLVYLYTDLIYFLSLIAEPRADGENLSKQVHDILLTLCFTVGIGLPKVTLRRGPAWTQIHAFFKSSPILSRAIVDSVLKPLTVERPMNFIERLAINQLKKIWQWYRLRDFHDCYVFAVEPYSEAHRLPIIVRQCNEVISLYRQLQLKIGNDKYLPYAGFYIDDEFLEKFAMEKYPALLYAVIKALANNGNEIDECRWRKMVATLPVDVPRMEIDLKLEIMLDEKAKRIAEEDRMLKEYVIIDI